MKEYVEELCERTMRAGYPVEVGQIRLQSGYRDGAVVGPVDYEDDKFCGIWFVELGLAVSQKFGRYRKALGQAGLRFSGAVKKSEADVLRDQLIEALDDRFGPENVIAAANTTAEAGQIWGRLWPCKPSKGCRGSGQNSPASVEIGGTIAGPE